MGANLPYDAARMPAQTRLPTCALRRHTRTLFHLTRPSPSASQMDSSKLPFPLPCWQNITGIHYIRARYLFLNPARICVGQHLHYQQYSLSLPYNRSRFIFPPKRLSNPNSLILCRCFQRRKKLAPSFKHSPSLVGLFRLPLTNPANSLGPLNRRCKLCRLSLRTQLYFRLPMHRIPIRFLLLDRNIKAIHWT